MKKDRRTAALLKFGKKDHLDMMRNEGVLYMNTQKFFSRLDADPIRGDSFEGVTRIVQPHDIKKLTIGSPDGTNVVINQDEFAGPLIVGRYSHNIFCMFAITEFVPRPVLVDPKNFEFGDSFIAITNTEKFIERFSRVAIDNEYQPDYDQVRYYDARVYSGETSVFHKSDAFAYQCEFRLSIYPGGKEPVCLRLGSLADITSPIYPLEQINNLLKVGEA